MQRAEVTVTKPISPESSAHQESDDILTQFKIWYELLKSEIPGAFRTNRRRYWDLVGLMQELANRGSYSARNYMLGVDLSKAPRYVPYQSNLARLELGAPSVSVRGARRQLLTDPNCLNKTYLSSGSIDV
jgi:hypothetical protein